MERECRQLRVGVCILTYKRPASLGRLLNGLNALTFAKARPPAVSVLVVDNDAEGSGRAVCKELEPRMVFPLNFVIEPRRGYSHARNTAVACVRDNVDFLAFIDDDEFPAPCWLDELLDTQERFDADIVTGPVLPEYDADVPAWVIRGRFFDRPRHATGALLHDARTGNCLMRSRLLESSSGPFDERFARTGGEDTHLFARLFQAGSSIRWADDAVVHETVSADRATIRWLLRRSRRVGSTVALCETEFSPGVKTYVTRLMKGIGRIGHGLALLPVSVLFGKHMTVRALRHMAYGVGVLSGLVRPRRAA
jgi:succinoglycan biosynthesis protein ExoM